MLRGEKRATRDEEGHGGHADGEVVDNAGPPPALVLVQADLLLAVLIVALDPQRSLAVMASLVSGVSRGSVDRK